MFALAFSIGTFSYIIFILGIIGVLYSPLVIALTVIFLGIIIFGVKHKILHLFKNVRIKNYSLIFLVSLLLLFLQALVNTVGVFGPEIGFDALWYHLTLPKLYLQYHSIFHIPGETLMYSDMPKLTEMLYTAGLAFSSEFFPKIIHFFFGILCCVALYKLARRFFAPTIAILAPLIFYSNLVVGWESISAYVDLSWTFFAIMSLWGFLIWVDTKKQEDLIKVGLLVGLTITTKIIGVGFLVLFAIAFLFYDSSRLPLILRFKRSFIFTIIAFIIPLPWFVFSFVHTGNPIYPLFDPILPLEQFHFIQILNPLFFISTFWSTFAISADPINPIYLLSLPFFFIYSKRLIREVPLLFLLAIGSFIIWYITPHSGGGRYVLVYLPIFTLLILYLLTVISQNWKKVFILVILFCALISVGYRAFANYKFVPVILRKETKGQFMANHLAFSLGDFYDIDAFFSKNIKPTDTVLLYGFHNLYYVDFPFIDSSWVQKGDSFNYLAIRGNGLPERFAYWNLIYFNNTSQVRVYAPPGGIWRY